MTRLEELRAAANAALDAANATLDAAYDARNATWHAANAANAPYYKELEKQNELAD